MPTPVTTPESEASAKAKTILQQIGPRALFMLGAKFVSVGLDAFEDNHDLKVPVLTVRLGGNPNKVTHVKIGLMPNDTYRVDFIRVRGAVAKTVSSHGDVYCDTLHAVLEAGTGNRTSL